MRRSPSIRPLLIVSTALLGLSLAPIRWLWWVSDVADIVAVPLAPLNDGGNLIASWLRPGTRAGAVRLAPLSGASIEEAWMGESDAVQAIAADRDTYRALWHAERLRNEDLLQRLADVRLAEQFHQGSVFEPLRADVIGRSPAGLRGPVRVNVGRNAGVSPGDVAVFRGAHLVARVVGDVDALTSHLLWIADPATGKLAGAVPREPEPTSPNPPAIRILLTPIGDGTFAADIAADAGVGVGDQVVLDDPTWPDTARGMIVGQVEAVERRDDQPLRVRLRVRPAFNLHELRSVMLKIRPQPDAVDRGGGR